MHFDRDARNGTTEEANWAFMGEEEKERFRRASRSEEEAARKAWADKTADADATRRRQFFNEWNPARILEIWKPAITGAPQLGIDALHLPVQGGAVHITRDSIRMETKDNATPSPESMRAAIQHIIAFWDGKATILTDAREKPETRLLQHAYAQVYGISVVDINGALTQAELARVATLCREVRALHPDAAPPSSLQQQGATRRTSPMIAKPLHL